MDRRSVAATAIRCVVSVFLLAGCRSDQGKAAAGDGIVEVTDSAGVKIVETRRVAAFDTGGGVVIDSVPVLRIGSVNDGPYALAHVDGITVDSDGRIFIADGGLLEVRSFSPEGKYLWASGRSGSGPGEYRGFSGIESCGDTIVVGDLFAKRLTLLDSSGRLLSTRDWPALQSYSAPLSFTCSSSGTFAYLDWEFKESADPGPYTVRAVIGGASSDEKQPHLITEFAGIDRYRYDANDGPAHFGKSTFVAAVRATVHVVRGDEAAVNTYDLAGNLKRIARWKATPERLTKEMIDADLERRVKLFPPRRRPGYRNFWRDLVRPEFLPVVSGLLATSNGDLWVQKYAVPGDSSLDRVWWIISPDGELRGSVRIPQDFELRRIAGNFAFGLTRDSLGVQYVEKRRLRIRQN